MNDAIVDKSERDDGAGCDRDDIGKNIYSGLDAFDLVRCPACGHTDYVQGFDVIGADRGCLFCNNCGHHGEMEGVVGDGQG